jgi:HAD superfamily hydrolase (TIGR01509 family)
MATAVIDTVVFDIGWVLVRFNYQPIIDLLRARGCEVDDLHALLERAALSEHESGRLHGHALLERLAGLATAPVSHAELHAQWVGMFELDPPMLDLAHRLSEHHKVYLLSNIGDLHWAHLSREYRFHALGHGALPSYLAGAMKPHADIYQEAERRFSLVPAATVFIDDRADNIAAARARGWQGIVHTDHRGTRAALRALGVSC